MNFGTLIIIVTQILCSVFVVFSLLKFISKNKGSIKHSSLDLRVEVSDLLNENSQLHSQILRLNSELDTKSNLKNKQDTKIFSLENKVKNSYDKIHSLEKELNESQRYLKNCWDKVKRYEREFGQHVNTIKLQPELNKSSEYNMCKACDKDIKYCICAR